VPRAIRQKLDQIDERQRDHTARFAAIEQRLVSIEQRLSIGEERFARIDARMELRDQP
jgi:hypothetical protein